MTEIECWRPQNTSDLRPVAVWTVEQYLLHDLIGQALQLLFSQLGAIFEHFAQIILAFLGLAVESLAVKPAGSLVQLRRYTQGSESSKACHMVTSACWQRCATHRTHMHTGYVSCTICEGTEGR